MSIGAADFEKIMEAVEPLRGKEICLVMGPTGSGKSTIISALMGLKLEKGEDFATGETSVYYENRPSPAECYDLCIPEIGLDESACTFYPRGYPVTHEGRDYVFYDMAGFFTNVSEPQAILTYLFLLAISKVASVKAILFVVDYSTFNSARAASVADAARILGEIFRGAKAFKNLFFLINKVEDPRLNDMHMKRRIEAKKNDGLELLLSRARELSPSDSELHEKICASLGNILTLSTVKIIHPLIRGSVDSLLNEIAKKRPLEPSTFDFALWPGMKPLCNKEVERFKLYAEGNSSNLSARLVNTATNLVEQPMLMRQSVGSSGPGDLENSECLGKEMSLNTIGFEKIIEAVKPLRGKEVCLVMGPAGSGKSTITSALMGLNLVQEEDFATGEISIYHRGRPNSQKCYDLCIPEIGSEGNACTFYPRGYPVFHQGREYIFCDMAGLFTHISELQEILTYLFLLAINKIASVKAILLVVDNATFDAAKAASVADAARLFGTIFRNQQAFENLFFLINKVEDPRLNDVHMKRRMEGKKKDEIELLCNRSEGLSSSDKKNHEEICASLDNILALSTVKIIHPLIRNSVDSLLNEVAKKRPLDPNIFDFALWPGIRPLYDVVIEDFKCYAKENGIDTGMLPPPISSEEINFVAPTELELMKEPLISVEQAKLKEIERIECLLDEILMGGLGFVFLSDHYDEPDSDKLTIQLASNKEVMLFIPSKNTNEKDTLHKINLKDIIASKFYQTIQSALSEGTIDQNSPENQQIKLEIRDYLSRQGCIEDTTSFLKELIKLIRELPEASKELQAYSDKLKTLNVDGWEGDEIWEDDPRLEELAVLHEAAAKSVFDVYNRKGKEWLSNRVEVTEDQTFEEADEDIMQGGSLAFRKQYPRHSAKIEALFKLLSEGDGVKRKINLVASKLNIPSECVGKLKIYFSPQKRAAQNTVEAEENYEIKLPKMQLRSREEGISSLSEVVSNLRSLATDDAKTKDGPQDSVAEETLFLQQHVSKYCPRINGYYEKYKKWGPEEIQNWARKKRRTNEAGTFLSNNLEEICETIAIMERANFLVTGGHRLRDTQKAAILIFMQTNNQGHISEIYTSEGKTTIISFVQALRVLQGYKGHIITSNAVLAQDGVNSRRNFYHLLGISVTHNNPEENYREGPRACYTKDIVYGSINNFQFDWLRDSFERLNTMGGLKFADVWVMLDEIDSLLIDQGGNMAKLSGPFPGMEGLRYIYINIWVALARAEDEVNQEDAKQLKEKAEFWKDSQREEESTQKEYEELQDKLAGSFLKKVKEKIYSQKDNIIPSHIIPNHLTDYIERSFKRWVKQACVAKYLYQENVEYKIQEKNGEPAIVPVDNQNTGVSMENTVLSAGLHQFLQLKHNLTLTYESLTSSYVSNLAYIQKYGNKLSGVTGTLGSESERRMLGSVFRLSFSAIPTYKPKQFEMFPGKILEDNEFIDGVATAALGEIIRQDENKVERPRAVLIVCRSKQDALDLEKEIEKQAKAARLKPNIKRYTDEMESSITEEVLNPGDIVIATNIAGRGTDLKTSKDLEKNGGLHVIEAFLPCNQRVQDQGFGRTSRAGNQGTGQIIARLSEVLQIIGDRDFIDQLNFEEIIEVRDIQEGERVDYLRRDKVAELEFSDNLFSKFSELYRLLKEQYKWDIDPRGAYVLRDLKEKWAFWLDEQAYTANKVKKLVVINEFEKFKQEALNIINGNISHNPFYGVCLAERYLEGAGESKASAITEFFFENRKKAKKELENALHISGQQELLYPAHIKLFEVAMEDGGQIFERYKKALAKIFFMSVKKDEKYKQRAQYHLEAAKKAIAMELQYLENLLHTEFLKPVLIEPVASMPVKSPNLLLRHLEARLICLEVYMENVKSLLAYDNEKTKKKESSEEYGIAIGTKVPKYLSHLSTNLEHERPLKEVITDRAVDELEYIGVSSIFELKKIYDVPDTVVESSQVQILTGLGFLATGTFFPPALPVCGPMASMFISEGITDIITALINQGEQAFNQKDYVKSKLISYGISLVTMGIGALLSSTKLLAKAMRACQSLANKLRQVEGPFAGICRILANKLDKLALHFQKMIQTAEFLSKEVRGQTNALAMLKDQYLHTKDLSFLSQFQELKKLCHVPQSHGQQLMGILFSSVSSPIKSAAISVGMEKIVTASLDHVMKGLQPFIAARVKEKVQKRVIEELQRKRIKKETIEEQLGLLFKEELYKEVLDILEQISLGVLRHCGNWKIQLAVLTFEGILTFNDIYTCTDRVCDRFFAKLFEAGKFSSEMGAALDKEEQEKIIDGISGAISAVLYSKILSMTGKIVTIVPQALYSRYQENKAKAQDKKEIGQIKQRLDEVNAADKRAAEANRRCVHDAVAETLGVNTKQLADASGLGASEQGASKADIQRLYGENGIATELCSPEAALGLLQKHNSDRGVACFESDGVGHAVPFYYKEGRLMVKEAGREMMLNDYKVQHGYRGGEMIVPRSLNTSNLSAAQYRINYNRIERAIYPISHVRGGSGLVFGARRKPEQPSRFKVHERNLRRAHKRSVTGSAEDFRQHGTAPNADTREWVNSSEAVVPAHLSLAYRIGATTGMSGQVPNPPGEISNGVTGFDAGHRLPAQVGGSGTDLGNISSQNPQRNRGNAGHYEVWRRHEATFAHGVYDSHNTGSPTFFTHTEHYPDSNRPPERDPLYGLELGRQASGLQEQNKRLKRG